MLVNMRTFGDMYIGGNRRAFCLLLRRRRQNPDGVASSLLAGSRAIEGRGLRRRHPGLYRDPVDPERCEFSAAHPRFHAPARPSGPLVGGRALALLCQIAMLPHEALCWERRHPCRPSYFVSFWLVGRQGCRRSQQSLERGRFGHQTGELCRDAGRGQG